MSITSNSNMDIALLYRGTNHRESDISLPKSTHVDYREEGVGIYAYSASYAQNTMVYALSQTCDFDAEEEPEKLSQGWVSVIAHDKSKGDRSLHSIFPSDCRDELITLINSLSENYFEMDGWKASYWMPDHSSIEDCVDQLIEQDNDMMTIYKSLCGVIAPPDNRELIELWKPLFNSLNSHYSLTENPGEVLIFDEDRLSVVGHKIIINEDMSANQPEHPGRGAPHDVVMKYISEKDDKNKEHFASLTLHHVDPVVDMNIKNVKSATDSFFNDYGSQLDKLSHSQQTNLLIDSLAPISVNVPRDVVSSWLSGEPVEKHFINDHIKTLTNTPEIELNRADLSLEDNYQKPTISI